MSLCLMAAQVVHPRRQRRLRIRRVCQLLLHLLLVHFTADALALHAVRSTAGIAYGIHKNTNNA